VKITDRMRTIIAVTLAGGALAGGAAVTVNALAFEDVDSAKADVCTSLDELRTTIVSYQGLNPLTATNDQLDAAYDDIAGEVDDLDEELDEWVNAYDNPLTDAYWDLSDAVADLDGDNTARENLIDLQDELAAYPEAFHETFDGSGCDIPVAS
jgi:hypothetical protein